MPFLISFSFISVMLKRGYTLESPGEVKKKITDDWVLTQTLELEFTQVEASVTVFWAVIFESLLWETENFMSAFYLFICNAKE